MIKKTNSIQMDHARSIDQFDCKCVCQLCNCGKHKCPHPKVNIPFEQISTYQKQFIPHPLNQTQKFSTDNSKYLNTSYGKISSAYQQSYPGHKPQMRQKIVPRVKNEQRDIPFEGESWYKSTYQPKSVKKDQLRNKDKQFNPCLQRFNGSTTYKSDFFIKRPHSQLSKPNNQITYPDGYKFNPNTTYANDFKQKGFDSLKSFKPIQKVADKGKHYLNTTYRQDFNKKKTFDLCPVLTLPKYPQSVNYPSQHVSFDKKSGVWEAK